MMAQPPGKVRCANVFYPDDIDMVIVPGYNWFMVYTAFHGLRKVATGSAAELVEIIKDKYKSSEGERLIRERYQVFLKQWPVSNEQLHVPTRPGSTFVVISSPEDAPPLLLLHGGVANSAMWMGEVAAFARSFRVYCVDMIGEPGLSPPARPSLASDAHAGRLDDVLDHLSVGRTSIAGASLGGWLGLDYAIRRPERVERVAVLCPGGIGRQKVGIVFTTLLSRMFGGWGKRKLMERILGRAPVDPTPPVKAFIDFMELIRRHFRPRMVKLPVFSDSAPARSERTGAGDCGRPRCAAGFGADETAAGSARSRCAGGVSAGGGTPHPRSMGTGPGISARCRIQAGSTSMSSSSTALFSARRRRKISSPTDASIPANPSTRNKPRTPKIL
jgi:pimeloyl-ACP methyl ester carboxylesterase